MAMRVYLVLALICAPAVLAETPPQPPGAEPADEDILFADLPRVEAASLHAQSLAEAPANVSVITAEEIRRYGYRTLGEALASVRGFYVTDDHSYQYVGVRGFSLPGDYNTRFLVMLNGHPLTDNIYNSNNFFEQDFGLDLELVERIEIIRGPTSALYGSNGMLANINVVTRSPAEARSLGVAFETSSFGERKLSLTSSRYLGHGVNLLVEGSVFDDQGISFPVAGLAVPAGVGSTVSGADGESGFHSFANLVWRGWSFTAYFNVRDKHFPVGVGTSLSGDPAQHVVDSRNLVEASYKRQAGPGQLQWRMAYDQYRYRDLYDYPVGDGIEPVRDINRGDWLDSSLTYDVPLTHLSLWAPAGCGSCATCSTTWTRGWCKTGPAVRIAVWHCSRNRNGTFRDAGSSMAASAGTTPDTFRLLCRPGCQPSFKRPRARFTSWFTAGPSAIPAHSSSSITMAGFPMPPLLR